MECYCLADGKSFEEYHKALNDEEEKKKVKPQVNKLLQQFVVGTMLSNILWGWWAVIVCKNPQVTFDYLEFGKFKHDNYMKAKNSGS